MTVLVRTQPLTAWEAGTEGAIEMEEKFSSLRRVIQQILFACTKSTKSVSHCRNHSSSRPPPGSIGCSSQRLLLSPVAPNTPVKMEQSCERGTSE